jgi:hypothetical protein
MTSAMNDRFLSNYDWFRAVVESEEQPVILCHTSALECLELFPGYGRENVIDVYATKPGKYDNVNYHIVPDINAIETVPYHSLRCTSLNRTVNDMLGSFPDTDWQALTESLAKLYRRTGSLDSLKIDPENMEVFPFIKEGAEQHFAM